MTATLRLALPRCEHRARISASWSLQVRRHHVVKPFLSVSERDRLKGSAGLDPPFAPTRRPASRFATRGQRGPALPFPRPGPRHAYRRACSSRPCSCSGTCARSAFPAGRPAAAAPGAVSAIVANAAKRTNSAVDGETVFRLKGERALRGRRLDVQPSISATLTPQI